MMKRFFYYIFVLIMVAIGMTGCDINRNGCDVCFIKESENWHWHAIGKGTVIMCDDCKERYDEICEFFEPITSWFREDTL